MRNEKSVVGRSIGDRVRNKVAARQNRGGSSYLLLPDGVEIFKPKKEANFRFNIIPYVVGDHNLDIPAGELDYEFTFWVHTIDNGEKRSTVVCPKKTYGKKCPICEMVERLSKDYAENEEEIKRFKAKQRQLFNIVDARDEDQKIQIYETSYFKAFGEMLDKRLRTQDEDDEDYSNFADIPGGRTLKVAYVEDTFNGNKFYAPSSIDFIDRREELSVDIIDRAVCLDSCLKVMTYDEILKLLADEEINDTDEDDKPVAKAAPARSSRTAPVKAETAKKTVVDDDENDEDEGDEDEEEVETKKPTRKAPAKKPVVKEIAVEEEDDDDNDDEEEVPKPTRKAPAKKPVAVEEDEYDDDDDKETEDETDDEEEAPKPTKKTPDKKGKGCGGKCPHGYTFGADCYIYEECDTCEFVEECDAAQ